ncbi:glycosyltransferase family 4 protein [Sporolactobacillus inulinus]|uniref:Glycosyl transferase family 1 domain-containing protein n=1 Tax=Sporolactobacillus inulinus CASD TaxID=1069536 RepID=A0A0U1QMG8_9BACL|nr:glycosyltransferase family 4 protein [Sporolactobacillus inulinus]KLI02007.1 hypothetical protein SINU_10395 [Sporolactobacillus inulinus CASD]GEB77843.1 glycosyl transferase [Sporolactobacillus inulinus]
MRLAIIGNESKPIPATEGGAVETIIDTFIQYNEKYINNKIDIYSKYNALSLKKAKRYRFTRGIYVNLKYQNSFLIKVNRKLNIINYKKIYINNVIGQMKGHSYDWIIVENRPDFVLPLREAFSDSKIALHMHNEHLTFRTVNAKKIIKALNKIIAVSDFIANKIKSIDINYAWKVTTLTNRVDINKFAPRYKDNGLCQKFNIDNQITTIVIHGRIVKEKGILEAIKAFKVARQFVSGLKLIIIGDIKNANRKYYRLLKEEINKTNNKESIVFTGYVSHNSVPDYLNLSDIILLPSIWNEPCSLSILESLAIGKSLITTRTGGTPEIVPNNCGILVKIDNSLVQQLAKDVVYLAKNKAKRNFYENNARKFAINNLDDRTFYNDFLKILE